MEEMGGQQRSGVLQGRLALASLWAYTHGFKSSTSALCQLIPECSPRSPCEALHIGALFMPPATHTGLFPSPQDAPYLDLAPYMPDYYKPQYLLDFEDRLPSSVHGSDSLSLNSFNSVTSTNLEWDDSAIAPSSEGKWLRPERRITASAGKLLCGSLGTAWLLGSVTEV